jgi:hypothetical protein
MEQRLGDPDKKRTLKSTHERLRKMLDPELQSVTMKDSPDFNEKITSARQGLETKFPESKSDKALDLKNIQAFVKAKNDDITALKQAQAANTKLLNGHNTFTKNIRPPIADNASIKTVATFRKTIENRIIADREAQIKIQSHLHARNISLDPEFPRFL